MGLNTVKARSSGLFEQWATGFTLVLLGVWPVWRFIDGTLGQYLHPRFHWLVIATGLVLIQLGGWLLWRGSRRASSENAAKAAGGLALLALVAVCGIAFQPAPTATIDADITGNASNNRVLAAALQKENAGDTANWNLLDWSAALNDSGRALQLNGKPVDVVGFVTHTRSRSFEVARYVVVCCAADTSALRLPVVLNDPVALEEGQWVQVSGNITSQAGVSPFIQASEVKLISQPAQPYLYP